MNILVDYISFSTRIHSLENILHLLGLDEIDFLAGAARNGWMEHMYFNGIHIYHGGREDIGVEMSGVGCRTLETCWKNGYDWPGLFQLLLDHRSKVLDPDGDEQEYREMHVSRLDIACDDREILDIKTITKYTSERRYISKARRCVWLSGDEQEVIFGSTKSSTRLRIYNKALERGVDGKWTRVEFQFRNEAAESFMANLMSYGMDFGRTFSGVLLNYLRYVTEEVKSSINYERYKIVKWWKDFLDASEKISNVTVGGLAYNYGSLEYFIKHQVLSSVKCWLEINNGDVSKFMEMVSKAKLNKKQEELIHKCRQLDKIEQNINSCSAAEDPPASPDGPLDKAQ